MHWFCDRNGKTHQNWRKSGPREWRNKCLLKKNMDFKAWNAIIGSAWVAEKMSNLWPKTWILWRKTQKSGLHEWQKKCLIYDAKHEFSGMKRKIGCSRGAEKVSNFWPNTWAWNGKIGSARVAEKVSNFWPKACILSRETENHVHASGGNSV